jgi:hypothetical protein
MKKLLFLTLITGFLFAAFAASAQQKKAEDKSKRPSPPDTVQATLSNGTHVIVAYSQPSIKGRTIGKEIAPYGQVWRTGANEETTIEVSKAVKLEGKPLAAGKYSIWSVPGEKEWVIIINKNTTNWGTQHDEPSDLFKVTVPTQKAPAFTEKMKFSIDKSGKVSFVWGNDLVAFNLK